MSKKIRLTEAEVALLEPFEYVACCAFLHEGEARGLKRPCWLVASEEAREEARDNAILLLARGGPTDPLAQIFIKSSAVDALRATPALWKSYQAWKQAETDFKGMREADPPNPRAFFAEYDR